MSESGSFDELAASTMGHADHRLGVLATDYFM